MKPTQMNIVKKSFNVHLPDCPFSSYQNAHKNTCYVSQLTLEYGIYFNIVDLCGILPYKRMYP